MHSTQFFLAVAVAGFLSMFTDWLLMGVLFHDKYLATPEIWRLKPGSSETKYIIASTLAGVVSCAAFLALCVWTGVTHQLHAGLHLAAVVWLAAPVPAIFSQVIWTKMHPLLGVSHSLGWLARFVVTALTANWLLP